VVGGEGEGGWGAVGGESKSGATSRAPAKSGGTGGSESGSGAASGGNKQKQPKQPKQPKQTAKIIRFSAKTTSKNKTAGWGQEGDTGLGDHDSSDGSEGPFQGMDLIFLGTSSGAPTTVRNVSAAALRLEGSAWLFDCGEGTQQQLMHCASVRPGQIDRIFITHLHGDHVYGLPGLLCGLNHQSPAPRPLHLYGPPGLYDLIKANLKVGRDIDRGSTVDPQGG
jgi:hypothetical protein